MHGVLNMNRSNPNQAVGSCGNYNSILLTLRRSLKALSLLAAPYAWESIHWFNNTCVFHRNRRPITYFTEQQACLFLRHHYSFSAWLTKHSITRPSIWGPLFIYVIMQRAYNLDFEYIYKSKYHAYQTLPPEVSKLRFSISFNQSILYWCSWSAFNQLIRCVWAIHHVFQRVG